MGFGNRFKKALGINKNNDNQSSLDNSSKNIKTDEGTFKLCKNFNYLNNLIHSESKEIVLDSDIFFDEGDDGVIFLDVDDIIIDGNGHSIDAKSQSNIFNITGKNITIKNLTFKNGFSQFKGGAVVNWGEASFKNCKFIDNFSKDNGGAIANTANCILKIIGTDFINNRSNNQGGAINNEDKSSLEIHNSNFSNNKAKRGGASYNMGDLTITGGEFKDNSSVDFGGAIVCSSESISDITDVKFENNVSKSSGAVKVFGKLKLNKCKFLENRSTEAGGAVFNENDLTIIDTEFNLNKSKSGGAISNYGKINLKYCTFDENEGVDSGGAIFNMGGGIIKMNNAHFTSNQAFSGAAIQNNGGDINGDSCVFCKNISKKNVIDNETSLNLFNPKIHENNLMDCIIYNDEDSKLDIIEGKIIDNNTNITAINNFGECVVHKTIFKNNTCSEGFGNIANEGNLTLSQPQFEEKIPSILNKGHIDAFEVDHELKSIIENRDGDIWDDSAESEFNFDYLNNLILNISTNDENEKIIRLEHDIVLGNKEFKFFEGGIELDIDDLTIEGNGKIIDGKNKTRIFNVLGKNITLKNIIFKNGLFKSDYENHTNGGGAIRIVKNGALNIEDCQFIDNHSVDDGGAILNSGSLNLRNTEFNGNNSEFYGGAVMNNGILKSQNDTFTQNKSKIGCAIYNNYRLILKDKINLSNNKNDFEFIKAIYNANYIKIIDSEIDVEKTINNTYKINTPQNKCKTFTFLNEKIQESTEIILNEDIKFDYKMDYNLVNGIDISNDLIIDGNGHSIDGSCISSLFNITDGRIVFKNLIFKNFYSNSKAIIKNRSDTTIENCKFINNKTAHGLIYNNRELSIVNVDFYNNYSKNKSLIDNECNLKITGSDFLNNDSNVGGACITNEMSKTITIIDSKFRFNVSQKTGGGAYNKQNATMNIVSCEFHANYAGVMGGAIDSAGKLNLNDTVFSHNSANNGGAVTSATSSKIVNVEFNHNYSDIGGAIAHGDYLSLNECMFLGNVAKSAGGAIFSNTNSFLEVIDTKFSECESGIGGGAILCYDRGYFKNNEFKFNRGKVAGAIHSQKANLEIDNNIFFGNFANNNGGALFNNGNVTLRDCKFLNNLANIGGAIENNNLMDLENCHFIKNTAKGNGGAINNIENGSLKVLNTLFDSNEADEGGAIWSFKKENSIISDCKFINNNPNDFV